MKDTNKKVTRITFTPALYAAQSGNLDLIKLLDSYGADFNCYNEYGKTPLDYAVQKKFYDCAMYMRDRGFKLYQQDIWPVKGAVEFEIDDMLDAWDNEGSDDEEKEGDGEAKDWGIRPKALHLAGDFY